MRWRSVADGATGFVHRHLDHPADRPMGQRGLAALDDLLDNGDLADWAPVAREVAADPYGVMAEAVLRLCRHHDMYGTSALWTGWIGELRARRPNLGGLRARRGLRQADVAGVLGLRQADVSKIESRDDIRLSTLRGYLRAVGARLKLVAVLADGETEITVGRPDL
jgi:hypothetical protein